MLEVRHVAIYDTYHMELPKVGTGVDLLGRLSEDDWREIAAANMQLGGEKEAVALGDVERIMRTDEIEGERELLATGRPKMVHMIYVPLRVW